MASLSDLQSAIESTFNIQNAEATLQLNNNTRERAFEGYIFSLLVRAVRQAGGTATIRGIINGANPEVVVFRGSGGLMGSRSQNFAYAYCVLGNVTFEIHLDIRYEGSSGAINEVDVSIYDHDAADHLRQFNASEFAKVRKLHAAFECKCYDSNLGTELGRTFIGLIDDCGDLRLKSFVTNGQSPNLSDYFQPKRRPQRFFRLSPLRPEIESEFINYYTQELRKWTATS